MKESMREKIWKQQDIMRNAAAEIEKLRTNGLLFNPDLDIDCRAEDAQLEYFQALAQIEIAQLQLNKAARALGKFWESLPE